MVQSSCLLGGGSACTLLFDTADEAPWLDDNWQRRRRIDFVSEITGTHTAFPWWIEIQDEDLFEHSTTASELAFVDASGQRLPVDVESFDSDGLAAWLLVDLDEADIPHTVYLYYDPAIAPEPGPAATEVWKEYAAVYHMQLQSYMLLDASGNENHAALKAPPQSVDGALGPSLEFLGNQFAVAQSSPALELDDTIQISAWALAKGWRSNSGTIVAKADAPGSEEHDYLLRAEEGWSEMYVQRTSGPINVGSSDWGTADRWTYIVGRYDGDSLALFLDDQTPIEETATGKIRTSNRHLVIGDFGIADVDDTRRWNGFLDEVRISGQPRSAEWIKTEYYNQSLGPESIRVGPVELVSK